MPIRTVSCNLGAERRCLSGDPHEYFGTQRLFHPHKGYLFIYVTSRQASIGHYAKKILVIMMNGLLKAGENPLALTTA